MSVVRSAGPLGKAFLADPGGPFSIPEHLAGWVEQSGDLWRRPEVIPPGEHRRQFVENLLEAHVEQFAEECFGDVSQGAPERSDGGPCQSLEQVGNRGPDAAPKAVGGRDREDAAIHARLDRRAGAGACELGAGDPALLREFARGGHPLAPGRRTFGGRAYTAESPIRCQAGDWSLSAIHTGSGEWTLFPFRCRSWRCRRCAPRVNARDAARIEDALGPLPLSEVLFLTLTFDRSRWSNAEAAWQAAREVWKDLRDRLVYAYGEGRGRARRKASLVYVQTWEQHKDGWPHVHALVWCAAAAADVRRRGSYQRTVAGEQRPIWRWARQVLRPMALASGFGPILDVQFPRRDAGALAGYLVKIAAELTGSAKKDQTPLDAPKGFRRIRATPKFLEPARRRSGEWTGSLLLAPVDLVLEELERGAESFEAAANAAKGRVRAWLGRRSVPSAARCSIRGDCPHTEAALTG